MKGDLSTLKKVCLYGSKVMTAGMAVIAVVILVLIVLGIGSLISGDISAALDGMIGTSSEDSTAVRMCSFLAILTVFVLAFVTVKAVRDQMLSIRSEHSPFTEDNTRRLIVMSKIYIAGAVILGILELANGHGAASVAFMFFGCILLSTVLYVFALMVRYGAVLQNESDHTL